MADGAVHDHGHDQAHPAVPGHASGNPRGKPVSWIAVAIIVLGFVVGGVGLFAGEWWLFWTGAVLAVVGGILGLVTGILDDVH